MNLPKKNPRLLRFFHPRSAAMALTSLLLLAATPARSALPPPTWEINLQQLDASAQIYPSAPLVYSTFQTFVPTKTGWLDGVWLNLGTTPNVPTYLGIRIHDGGPSGAVVYRRDLTFLTGWQYYLLSGQVGVPSAGLMANKTYTLEVITRALVGISGATNPYPNGVLSQAVLVSGSLVASPTSYANKDLAFKLIMRFEPNPGTTLTNYFNQTSTTPIGSDMGNGWHIQGST